jgi:hypothetical protein
MSALSVCATRRDDRGQRVDLRPLAGASTIACSPGRQRSANARLRRLATVVAAASVLPLTGCMPFVASGPMTSEQREIDAVSTVVLDTSGDLSISEGEPSLVVHAPRGALDRLTSEVNGETLVLSTDPEPEMMLGAVRYELVLPELQTVDVNGSGDLDATVSADGTIRVDLDGSGDIRWTGLDAERVEIRVAGSGEVEVAGATAELAIELAGSGNVEARDLRAQEADVSITGSGDIEVSARESLSAQVTGSGRVTYSGDPAVTADVSGSGEVVKE